MAPNLNPISTQNPRRRVVAINASGGALVTIQPTGSCRYMEIQECPPGGGVFDNNVHPYSPQGLNYTKGDDGFVAIIAANPGAIITLGDNSWARDKSLSNFATATDPAGNAIPQSPQAQLKLVSATSTATQVEVREYV